MQLTKFMISRSGESEQPSTPQQREPIEEHSKGTNLIEVRSDSSHLKIEIDQNFPDAEFIAQQLLAILEDKDSFIQAKDKTALTEHKNKDDDELWGMEIAAQLQTQKQMRIGGSTKEEQEKRNNYAIEALKNEQSLELDLGIL